MPAVSRKGDSLTTGHICVTTTTLATPGQGTVYAESELIARITDPTVAHPYPPSPPCANHTSTVKAGSATVFCEGKKVARVTDSADLGALTSGAGTVFAGG
jgi:uncharacterized Zn-binding protein involved in type VI secretion